MRLLLDTHALLWWLSEDAALPASARRRIANSSVLVSAASAWEIATKYRLGRLSTAADLVDDFAGYLQREQFESLPMTQEHAIRAGLLPGVHRDPFDRMLAAQAQAEQVPILSRDEVFDSFGVRRIW